MRYLVLSDIHSNLAAFEAVLSDAGEFDRIWSLGDVVGYGPDPNACIEQLKSRLHLGVCGNHDCGCTDRIDVSDFNPEAQEICQWTGQQLTPENRTYLLQRPERLMEGDFTIVHGSPRHPIWEYVIYTLNALENFEYFETPYCFIGHTHVPCVFQKTDDGCEVMVPEPDAIVELGEERLIINPGSVGQPRDGDERASYLLLDTDAMTCTYRRVPYPVYVTQQRMRKANLPERQIRRLSLGW